MEEGLLICLVRGHASGCSAFPGKERSSSFQAEQLDLAKAKIVVPGCDVAVENIRHKLNASAVQNRLFSISLFYLF